MTAETKVTSAWSRVKHYLLAFVIGFAADAVLEHAHKWFS